MRKTLLSIALLIIALSVFAQSADKIKTVPTTYDRSSLGVLFLNFEGDRYFDRLVGKVENISFPDKYNNNNFPTLLIKPPFSRQSMPLSPQSEIKSYLEAQKAGLQTIAKWYSRQPNGTMSLDLVHERGRFSATDDDFLRAQTTKRGSAALEDYGNRLVNLSYILVIDVKDIKNAKDLSMTNMKGWQATAVGYLYRINFTEEVQNAFYDTWIYEDDSKSIVEEKRRKFEALDIPLILVSQEAVQISAMQPESSTGLGMFVKPKSEDELMQDLAQKSLDEVIYKIEMKVEEFKVKTSIHQVSPIRAKIGLKEGLKTDYRFFVYEYVYNEKLNQAVPKRRGVIRAGSKSTIVDNRKEATGKTETSKFYQVAGSKLEEGFTIQQQNDFGLEITAGPEIGGIGGFYGRADVRLGRFVGIRSAFVYVEGGIDAGDYNGNDYAFMRYGGGLAKGFQLMRNIELRPYAGVNLERATSDSYSEGDYLEILYFKAGVNLALNLKHNFQIIGGFGSHSIIGNATDKEGNEWDWLANFNDREGVSTLVGIKIMF
jgi:hypothetical protein